MIKLKLLIYRKCSEHNVFYFSRLIFHKYRCDITPVFWRQEALSCREFNSPREVIECVYEWKEFYNNKRRHSSLAYSTPAEFKNAHLARRAV
jgi:hypothetical protein